MTRSTILRILLLVVITIAFLLPSFAGAPRVVQIVANSDNMFKVTGQKKAVITAKPGEVLRLQITSQRGTESDKDGTVHGFTINTLKDQGWDLRLKPGTQEFTLVAPAVPGEYVVECTVKCGAGHEDMKMKLVVAP